MYPLAKFAKLMHKSSINSGHCLPVPVSPGNGCHHLYECLSHSMASRSAAECSKRRASWATSYHGVHGHGIQDLHGQVLEGASAEYHAPLLLAISTFHIRNVFAGDSLVPRNLFMTESSGP